MTTSFVQRYEAECAEDATEAAKRVVAPQQKVEPRDTDLGKLIEVISTLNDNVASLNALSEARYNDEVKRRADMQRAIEALRRSIPNFSVRRSRMPHTLPDLRTRPDAEDTGC